MTTKKCTKKRDARAKLFSNFFFFEATARVSKYGTWKKWIFTSIKRELHVSTSYEFLDKLFLGKFYTAGKREGISIASPTRTRLRQLYTSSPSISLKDNRASEIHYVARVNIACREEGDPLSRATRAATKTSICKVYALGGDLDGYEGLEGHAHSSGGKSPTIAA